MFQLGKPVTHIVSGKTYTFPRLGYNLVLEWRDWIAEQIGDPFADVVRLCEAKAPDDLIKEMSKDAKQIKQQLESFSLGCPLAQRFFASEIGISQLAYFMLRVNHSDMTPNLAFEISMELGAKVMGETINKTVGEPPAKNVGAPAR